MTCRTCTHYKPSGLGVGECHRYPPTTMAVGGPMVQVMSAWTPTKPDDQCGEWAAAPIDIQVAS